ncbi:hypothetical protein [Micrococcus yunnanensis]|uniref:hypothetical protein n=1 Tax=Micrococcus yunnanensis TaxID=566027 RepID=UPI00178ADBC2|nr:hypothetical protein [Micrococcus yunnanensis]MBE1539657.1 hypothetical protein [Micrococcus yunnanensis]
MSRLADGRRGPPGRAQPDPFGGIGFRDPTRCGGTAGPEGLAWLTVHRRKPGLGIGTRAPD